jgi:hypothetical protein
MDTFSSLHYQETGLTSYPSKRFHEPQAKLQFMRWSNTVSSLTNLTSEKGISFPHIALYESEGERESLWMVTIHLIVAPLCLHTLHSSCRLVQTFIKTFVFFFSPQLSLAFMRPARFSCDQPGHAGQWPQVRARMTVCFHAVRWVATLKVSATLINEFLHIVLF